MMLNSLKVCEFVIIVSFFLLSNGASEFWYLPNFEYYNFTLLAQCLSFQLTLEVLKVLESLNIIN